MRTTEHPHIERRPVHSHARVARAIALCCLAAVMLFAAAGCSGTAGAGSSVPTQTADAHMAGPPVDIHITQAAADARPKAWVLTSPESAVRSYLDWTTYAYRTAQSDLASATMSADEGVRVDSYIQLNIEKKRLIDQKLNSIVFGTPSVGTSSTLLPAKEKWTYSYLSIDTGNKVLAGPYTASYDTTYTVVKTKAGWIVDSVKATALGTVK